MSEVQESACPLCKSVAKVERHPMKKSNHYICLSCGELVIKQKAESWLLKSSEQVRQVFADKAKNCPKGSVLFISMGHHSAEGNCLLLEEALRQ